MSVLPIDKSLELYFLGRNGHYRMCGLVVSPFPNANVIYFEPLTSRGVVGRCSMQIPFSILPSLIEVLQVAASPINAPKPGPNELIAKFGVHREHPSCSRAQWRAEVAMDSTQRGYWDFVAAKLEQESSTSDS